jgi:6-pyruvoyltetrahydropterin/6-carboxytetrahydropterin synthase
MFEVSVEDTFAAGHALRGYRGKCENPHGHNYRIRVTLTGDSLDEIGLLYDFKDLKGVMNAVIDELDHKFLNDVEPFRQQNPSAENMARYFYQEIRRQLPAETDGRIRIKQVELWETDTARAVYFE